MSSRILSWVRLLGDWHRIMLANSAAYRAIAWVVGNFIATGRLQVDLHDDPRDLI